jgi:hypothetical protein
MRTLQCSRNLTLSSIIVISIFTVASCATTINMKKVVVQSSDHYKFQSQQDGFRISVDPYIEKSRLQDYFGCDLISRGILPVFMIVENVSSDDGYIILSDKTILVGIDAINEEQVISHPTTDDLGKATKNITAINKIGPAVPLTGVLGLAILPFGLAAEKKFQDEVTIQRNLEKKQLNYTKTIYRGDSQSGFLYLSLEKAEDLNRVQSISLIIKNIRTNEIASIPIIMDNLH